IFLCIINGLTGIESVKPDIRPGRSVEDSGEAVKVRTGNGGFTLVELIIAVAVMCLSLLTLTVAITSASRINDNSRERAIAYELAKSKMEEIRNFTRCGSFDRIFYYYGHRTVITTPNPNGQLYAFVGS